jgi:hypothetical protein
MHWRVGRQLLEYARHADVAGVQDHLSREEMFGHPGRAALPESRGVCVGEDHDAHRLIVPARRKLHRIHRRARRMAHRLHEYREGGYSTSASSLCSNHLGPRSIPMRARVVPCLLQLATVDLTLRVATTRMVAVATSTVAAMKPSTEAARLSGEEDNPAA